jgi:uncharacterized membrane protein
MDAAAVVIVFVLAGGAVLLGPVLALVALLRAGDLRRRLDGRSGTSAAGPSIEERLAGLEARLALLERPAATAPQLIPVPMARAALVAEAPASVQPPPLARAAVLESGASAGTETTPGVRTGGFDLEMLIAGRGLHYIGLLLVLVASGFFLKLVIDNGWIGPRAQVALGLAGGIAVMAAGQRFFNRGYRPFSDGMTGLGAGILYLSLWAGSTYYGLLPPTPAFAGMVAVTAAQAALALKRSREHLALLALVGGFLTPALIGSSGGTASLFAYLALLDASLLIVAWARGWRVVAPVAFGFTQAYFWGRYDCCRAADGLAAWLPFVTAFFLIFAALPALRARVATRLRADEVVVTLLSAATFLLAIYDLLGPGPAWSLTVAMLALAGLHAGIAGVVPRASADGARTPSSLLYGGLALLFITLAIAGRLDGPSLTVAWTAEAGILMWSGFHARLRMFRGAAFVLLGFVVLRLLGDPIEADRALLNARFATFGIAVAVAALAVALWRRHPDVVQVAEWPLFRALAVLVNVLAILALSLEVSDALAAPAGVRGQMARPHQLGQQLGLSLLWTTYAAALMTAGVRGRSAGLRWQAIVLFGLVVVKVLVFDLSYLEGGYRVVSSVALGVVLLLVSLVYQRRVAAARAREGAGDLSR